MGSTRVVVCKNGKYLTKVYNYNMMEHVGISTDLLSSPLWYEQKICRLYTGVRCRESLWRFRRWRHTDRRWVTLSEQENNNLKIHQIYLPEWMWFIVFSRWFILAIVLESLECLQMNAWFIMFMCETSQNDLSLTYWAFSQALSKVNFLLCKLFY